MYTNTIIKFGFRMISCIFKPRVWVTCLSLRLRLITHISFRQFMISTQLHPIHIELLITTFTISQTGRRCATQLGEGEGSSQCSGEETEKVWSGWFSLELLARCLTPFVFRHWQVTVRIQIWVEDEGLMMELTTRRNSKLEKKVPRSVDPSCEVSKIYPQA